jgi:hypothetical protein
MEALNDALLVTVARHDQEEITLGSGTRLDEEEAKGGDRVRAKFSPPIQTLNLVAFTGPPLGRNLRACSRQSYEHVPVRYNNFSPEYAV